jgi:hypothetical protein
MAGTWSTQNQGRPGQGVSAACFLLAQKPYDLESDKEPEAKDVHKDTLETADWAAMRILANNRSVRGTMAARMARDTTTTEDAPSWTGIGANYMAWVQALKQDPMSPEAAVNEEAPERAYLAIMNGAMHLSVLHYLHRWKALNGGAPFDGCIVAFEGEARDAHGLPLLWKFDKQEELLLQCRRLTASALHHASMFYRDGNKDDCFHTCRTPPSPEWHGETFKTCRHLIPIPVEWTHLFLDCPSMGTAFHQTIQLMFSAEAAERHHLRPFCEGVAWACGSPDPRATKPRSALNFQWRWVAYTKVTLTLATAAWEGHRPASRKPPPPRQKPWPPSHFDLIFGGTARE